MSNDIHYRHSLKVITHFFGKMAFFCLLIFLVFQRGFLLFLIPDFFPVSDSQLLIVVSCLLIVGSGYGLSRTFYLSGVISRRETARILQIVFSVLGLLLYLVTLF